MNDESRKFRFMIQFKKVGGEWQLWEEYLSESYATLYMIRLRRKYPEYKFRVKDMSK